MIGNFTNLNDSFNGKSGTAIRGFYCDWHLPLLTYFHYTLKEYVKSLENVKKASLELDSDSSAYIQKGFLDVDLTNSLKKSKWTTTELVDETNALIDSVSDIVLAPRLKYDQFLTSYQQAQKKVYTTIQNLEEFDDLQTKKLNTVEHDINTMYDYLKEIKSMLHNRGFQIEHYDKVQLKDKPSYSNLKRDLTSKRITRFGHILTSPFQYINGQMSWGDNLLAGYQTLSAATTLLFSRKLKIHYFGSKPTLWEKLRGKYEFSVKTDPSWTSKGKHSSKVAKALLNFSRSPQPANPFMGTLHSYVSSYQSPAHLYKHVAGFPKNFNRLTGAELMGNTTERIKTGTKEVIGRVATSKGLVTAGKRIPVIGNAVTLISNLGEFTEPENSEKSFSEKTGRFISGTGTDFLAIGAGAKIGATVGSIGGPVGIVVGGAVGGLVGGVVSSKYGDKIKDFGGKVGKEVGKVAEKVKDHVVDFGKNVKKSIVSWFN
ncbi:LXG domain-containing protein [Heyndrickxia sporothermodurans]|uniref:LXG domain-containing protein n=1 Tax=Heyndrickxia sporothermodurans TaxID=46224 RepID=UPI002DB6B83C|nr:LXG domain-containing protein [Heyndrickxia sporothermodurans]MEB6548585.1 LXG domain-containing protein [Heyndrickxia sporothermodurans]MED3651845.1 LXG domain-containing protein [Heyndrickxia sporothermodurans]MED3653585.1 LXG domain-containing protein [Heyndrickxia sporothermodurans]MED3699541.1 LXG domain-containing protein [Heyndrickxia sporothermodurans]MED3782418.1 LXG domain-containing protein [Heyndrickxia sporothermodurans]